jgi:hypothetical protein
MICPYADHLSHIHGMVEAWHIDRLIPYGSNARTHSDGQVAQIAAMSQSFVKT